MRDVPSIPRWMLTDYLQDEIAERTVRGTREECIALRRFAAAFQLRLNEEYIDNTIAYLIRAMSTEEFSRWLNQRGKRDESIRSE
jgi:hypothetical protein